jgi:hypothetical protein
MILCPPQGEINVNPSREDLRQLFFETDEAFWLDGSADAGLHYDSDGANMIFHFVSGYGFCCLFQHAGGRAFVLICEGASTDRLEVKLSGNAFFVDRSYLAGADVAFKAAVTYLGTGALSSDQRWEPFNAVLKGEF